MILCDLTTAFNPNHYLKVIITGKMIYGNYQNT